MKKRFLSLGIVFILCLSLIVPAFASSSDFVIEDGVLTAYNGPGGNVVIPNGVTAIGTYAFGYSTLTYDKFTLTSVTIPASVTVIMSNAFQACSNLRQVNFSEGLTYIAESAFSSCTGLNNVTIPSSVKYIDNMAFYGCSALSALAIPDSVMIDRNAFGYCDLVPEQYQPRYISSDSNDLIQNGFWIDSDGVLYRYSGKGGDVVIPSNVVKIEDTAFLGCTSMTSVTIPDSVVFLGDNAFSGCTNLERVTFGTGLVFLNDAAFGGSFTRGSETYTGCPSLKEVRFPALSEQESALQYSDLYRAFSYSHELETIINCPSPEVADRRTANDRILTAWKSANPQTALAPQSERITALSNQICAGLTSNYAKAEAIYHWMAENIEYDYDYYYHRKQSVALYPEDVIAAKLTVCEGYSRLTQALLQAQGIPALRISGLANGISGWEGHAWNLAYVDGRWIYLDATWGSKSGGNSDAASVKWFDPTDLFLAFSHKGEKSYTDPNGTSGDKTPSETMFVDVKTDDYFAAPVLWAVDKGITAGTSATTFGSNSTCTQAQILTFLWRAYGSPNPAAAVSGSEYYAIPFQWAQEQSIISSSLDPNSPCTRADVVTYLWKLAGSPSAKAADFSDVPASASYAGAVNWAVENGVTAGTSASTFGPSSTCTRAQIVTFLYAALAK